MEAQAWTFASSPFVPVAIGFFSLGTSSFIRGVQASFRFAKNSLEVMAGWPSHSCFSAFWGLMFFGVRETFL
jgi:hypothetical protein